MNRTAALYALLSAALFGISTPAAKGLVGTVDPIMLAGLLYCGAGVGVATLRRVGHVFRNAADGSNRCGDKTSDGWLVRLPPAGSRGRSS